MDTNINALSMTNLDEYEKIFFISLDNNYRQIPVSRAIIEFKTNLIVSACELQPNCEILDLKKAQKKLTNLRGCDVYYPFVGENLDFLNKLGELCDLYLHFLVQCEDLFCWKFATKFFFNLKKNIPDIIKNLSLAENSKKN